METLLSLGLALLFGLLLSRVAKLLGFPAVTAYLVGGILLGPYLIGALGVPGIGFTSMENVEHFSIICDVALGFIAFSMGNEFRIDQLKKTGKKATVIGVFQAVATTVLVDAVLIGLHFMMPDKLSLSAAIVLGAIAAATAPAATMMVVKQYKAKGPLTDILLPVVALDDAVGLVLFAVSFGVAKAISLGETSVLAIVLEPLIEVVFSLLIGLVLGLAMMYIERFFHSRAKRLSVAVAFVFLTVAISMLNFNIGGIHVGFSSLLACMMLGTVFSNIASQSKDFMDRMDRWTEPIYILFFTLSGAELEFSVFADVMIIIVGIVYILARSAGKYMGAYASAKAMRCDRRIVKYLGVTLLPQAGVALGMAMKASTLTGDGTVIANIVLFAVLIYEFVGPTLTKIALQLAGDIAPEHAQRHVSHGYLSERNVADPQQAESTAPEKGTAEDVDAENTEQK